MKPTGSKFRALVLAPYCDGQDVGEAWCAFQWVRSLAQEAELARALDRMREAQRLANVGSWSWDIRDGSVHWSEQMFRITEVDPEGFDETVETFFRP